MITPYDTGRIKIGCNYQHPVQPWFPSRTEAMLQDALLTPPRKFAIDWDGVAIVGICIVTMVAGYAWLWSHP